jgi:DNA-binding NarL/FixJ family response regulator
MSSKKSIIIVDDHPFLREGLKTILRRSADLDIVGEAGTSQEGLRLAATHQPDIALVDIALPDQSGIELIRFIKERSPATRVLVVSMHAKIDYIVKAFRAGALGYVVKESAADMLLDGIKHVLDGNYFMDTAISQKVVRKLAGLSPKEKVEAAGNVYDRLTAREQEVMTLLAQGGTTRRIAETLYISPKTVENHRANIMRKLGLHSTFELIRYAAKLGLIDIDTWKG